MVEVTVTQRDRDAAWPFRADCYGSGDIEGWMNGKYDHVRIIRAFARHRASTAPDAEPVADRPVTSNPVDDRGSGNTSDKAVAQAVEALRDLVEEYIANVDSTRLGGFYQDPETEDCVIAARAALAAMGERS